MGVWAKLEMEFRWVMVVISIDVTLLTGCSMLIVVETVPGHCVYVCIGVCIINFCNHENTTSATARIQLLQPRELQLLQTRY